MFTPKPVIDLNAIAESRLKSLFGEDSEAYKQLLHDGRILEAAIESTTADEFRRRFAAIAESNLIKPRSALDILKTLDSMESDVFSYRIISYFLLNSSEDLDWSIKVPLKEVSRKCGMSYRKVQMTMDELISSRILVRLSGGKGQGVTATYAVNAPELWEVE